VKRIAVVLAPGFEELEASAFLGVLGFSRTIEAVDPISADTVAVEREVTGAHGLVVRVTSRIADANAEAYAGAAVPGGFHEKGYSHAYDPPVLEFLRKLEAAGATIAATSTGSRVLAAAGLLVGKRATTYPFDEGRHRAYLAECGAHVSDKTIERDGAILTASTPMASIETSFELLRALEGDRAVAAVRRAMGA